MSVDLHGYHYSVYAWIARFALHEKGVAYNWVEINPFAADVSSDYFALHPFGRVPALVHKGFELYETSAITHYIDEAFDGVDLQPKTPAARARVKQIISIIDNYAYWPLVRQVYSHGVFNPRFGLELNLEEYRIGLMKAPVILDALDKLAEDGHYLIGDSITLADIHLGPMISCFSSDPEGLKVLDQYERLASWWSNISLQPTFVQAKPELPELIA